MRRRDHRTPSIADEQGFTFVELAAATAIILVILLVVGGLLTTARRIFGVEVVPSTATTVAAERVERIRALPYEQVALRQMPEHADDPVDPDFDVAADGSGYDTGVGVEPLAVDPSTGTIDHLEQPRTIGTSDLRIYQYVTWVDDPSPEYPGDRDYKRYTVVVSWRRSAQEPVADRITMWTYVWEDGEGPS